MIIQEDFPNSLRTVVQHYFDVGAGMVPSLRSTLFNVQSSETATEEGIGHGGFSADAWDQYQKNRTKGRLENNELYKETYTHVEYPVQLAIEHKLAINGNFNVINKLIQKAGVSAEEKMERDAAGLLNNAFSSSHTHSDAVALCSASHPVGPHTTGTYSNRGTLALTKANLSTARIAMSRFKDDKQNLVGGIPNELWVPEELYDTAVELTGSPQDPESANNAINPDMAARRWTVYPWLRLTDTTNWFIANSTKRRMSANWYIREVTTPMLVHQDTTEYIYEFKLHYSYGVDDWRWIYGNEVAGA